MIEKNDIVQIVDANHPWFPSILIVEEVKKWGVQAFLCIPESNTENSVGFAYTRLEFSQVEKVGRCAFGVE